MPSRTADHIILENLSATKHNRSSAQKEAQATSCSTGTGDLMHRVYTYQDNSANNGNIGSIANCLDSSRNQNFKYDRLNRIQAAWTDGPNWGEQFTIDAWGNLTNISSYNQKSNSESLNASALPNNQLTGLGYDSAGNQTSSTDAVGIVHTYQYDGEGHLTNMDGPNVVYVYDGDGNRVVKNLGGSGTVYWQGANGEILAESDLRGSLTAEYVYFNGKRIARTDNPSSSTEASLKYYLSDHLGSTSIVTDATFATTLEDSDYYPYGRKVVQNGSDSNHYEFTGKERDTETGLDYFGARYYGSNMGRFMSPDVSFADQDRRDPQSWNLYSYVRNNPLSSTDPTGFWCVWEDGTHDDDSGNGGESSGNCTDKGGHWDPYDTITGVFQHDGIVTQINTIQGNCTSSLCGIGMTLEGLDQTLNSYSVQGVNPIELDMGDHSHALADAVDSATVVFQPADTRVHFTTKQWLAAAKYCFDSPDPLPKPNAPARPGRPGDTRAILPVPGVGPSQGMTNGGKAGIQYQNWNSCVEKVLNQGGPQ